MSPVRQAWKDFVEAAHLFSRPARHYLASEFLAWNGHGVFAVVFNLYLVEAGYQEGFIGRALAMGGLGLALVALPAGWLADRLGRRRVMVIGALLEGLALLVRVSTLHPGAILASSFAAGAGQSMMAIAAAPFITEHSTTRERTHLFSSFFAMALLAAVAGNVLGGVVPWLLVRLPGPLAPGPLVAYRIVLLLGAASVLAAAIPLVRLGPLAEAVLGHEREKVPRAAVRKLASIGLNGLLIGLGAGLVIPFMNLYFRNRFDCSSAQIGIYFSVAQVFTALASLLGPALAKRFGKLRAAVGLEIASLPFLVLLGGERHLPIAVVAFWLRATFMQASTPLLQNFIMESLPSSLRARASSLLNMLWNVGWAASSSAAGLVIERFGYVVPFYMTAGLYLLAAVTFYLAFRNEPESGGEVKLSEEAKGQRIEGVLAD